MNDASEKYKAIDNIVKMLQNGEFKCMDWTKNEVSYRVYNQYTHDVYGKSIPTKEVIAILRALQKDL